MSDYNQTTRSNERITRLETRMDNHEVIARETKETLKDLQKDQKWQTKQIFMGLGGLGALYIVLQIILSLHK